MQVSRLLIQLLLGSVLIQAQEHSLQNRKWRNIWAIGACAFEVFDTATTFHDAAIDYYGREKVPFLRDSKGKPSGWKFAIVKPVTCGITLWAANSKHVNETTALSISGLVMGQDAVRGIQNLGIKKMEKVK